MDKIIKAVKAPAVAEETPTKAVPTFIGDSAASASASYDLAFPMEFEGNEYRTANFSRLKGKHFHKMQILIGMGAAPDVVMASLVTGLPIEVLNEMDAEDYAAIADRCEPFIPARFRKQESGQE